MRRTLFLIPHELAGVPIFGIGWVLALIVVAAVARLWWAKRNGQSIGEVIAGEGIMWAIVIAAVTLVLPRVELQNAVGGPIGMAVRGYGAMLIAGVASAVGLAAWRAKNRRVDPEVIYSLAPWLLIGGIAGARIFYLAQYRDRYQWDSPANFIGNLFSFTEGGLVVYGGFIGGFVVSALFILRNKLPLLRLGDAIVPCMFIGVFFGRIGCLMNGCCYGGRCEDNWAAIYFPQGSPVYSDQLSTGELLGMKANPASKLIEEVTPDSLASNAGLKPGDTLDDVSRTKLSPQETPLDIPSEDVVDGVTVVVNSRSYYWSPEQLPKKALPVQAAQIISSVCALALCALLCALSLVFRREGAVMLLGFASYAVLRFVLELVRVDEAGQFGTHLTISQWVSVVVLTLSVIAMIWLYRQRGSDPAIASEMATG